jgi:hypothetical protein
MVVGIELIARRRDGDSRLRLSPRQRRALRSVMRDAQQVGRATTTAWSPTRSGYRAGDGSRAVFRGRDAHRGGDHEAVRHYVGATVRTPFFNRLGKQPRLQLKRRERLSFPDAHAPRSINDLTRSATKTAVNSAIALRKIPSPDAGRGRATG